jgi:predicted nucleic acid-binding protein
MSAYRVLVDSSVWIAYFRSGGLEKLDRLIQEDLACINQLIFTELAPVLMQRKENEILAGLQALEMVPLKIDWEIIREYQLMNLENGIIKVGIPDMIILQQVIDLKLSLFSFDNHFRLMRNHLTFDLVTG